MDERDQKIAQLKKLTPLFESIPEVGFVYLYGSRARGKEGPQSDFDFAIYFDEPDVKKRHAILFRLATEVSKILGTDLVDMHSFNDLQSPELKFGIIHEGILLFERAPHRLVIEPRVLNEYFDFTYLLHKYHLTKAPS